jgi:tetratricopeptide (TPR) repeat protein
MSWTFCWRYFYGEHSDQYNYLDSAIVFCNQALALDPDLSDGYALSGLFNVITGNPEKALVDLNRAKYLNPNDPRVYRFLGLLFHSKLDYKKAIENYLRAEKLEHSSYELLILKGKMIELFLAIGANNEAESYIEELMKLEPNNYLGFMMYGWLALEQGNFEAALDAYRKGLIQSQDHPYFLRKLGETYAYLGRFSESKEYWMKLKSIKGEKETDLSLNDYRYAYTLWMNDDKEKALQHFEDYITYYKEYIKSNSFREISGAYYNLASIYAFLGNEKEAFKWLHEQEKSDFVIDNSIIGTFTYDDFILFDPLFDNIKDEKEFKQIVERAQAKRAEIRAEVREIINSSDI